MAENRAGAEELIQRQPPVEDVAADKSETPLQIARPQRQPSQHRGLEPRRVGVDRIDHQVRDRVTIRAAYGQNPAAPEDVYVYLGGAVTGHPTEIYGGAGDDFFDDYTDSSFGGSDTFYGGAGNDTIYGWTGCQQAMAAERRQAVAICTAASPSLPGTGLGPSLRRKASQSVSRGTMVGTGGPGSMGSRRVPRIHSAVWWI